MRGAEDLVLIVARQLQRTVRAKGSSQRQVETALGWGKGYFSQFLSGNVDLKLAHVFRVLEHLDVRPAAFFADAFASLPPGYDVAAGPHHEVAEPEVRAGLLPLVREVVTQELDRRLPAVRPTQPRRRSRRRKV